ISRTTGGVYPSSKEDANGGEGLKSSDTTNLEYSYSSIDNNYCLSATSTRAGVPGFSISSEDGAIREGVCQGHTPPITNSIAGHAWTARSIDAQSWSSVAYGGGTFLAAAARTTTDTSLYSTSGNGVSWSTPGSIGTAPAVEPSTIYAGGAFVT